jgi:Ran GTPase-activating protein (RanGAP) involved in mRNA processing and transport
MRKEIMSKIQGSPSEQVNLGGMGIIDDELSEIVKEIVNKSPQVKEVYLDNNRISNEGATILQQFLAQLKELSVLDLQNNYMDINGAEAVYSLRTKNQNLKILFHGNDITNVAEMDEIKKI